MSVPLLKRNKNFTESQLYDIRDYGKKLTLGSIKELIFLRRNCIVKTSLHTFYVQENSVYYVNKEAFVFYIDYVNGVIYYNTELSFKWQKAIRYYYSTFSIVYITTKQFEQFYLLTVDDVVFKNIKHKREVLARFQMSLKRETESFGEINSIEFSEEDEYNEEDGFEDEYDEVAF